MEEMQDELTEITLINPKPVRPPSLWMNMTALIVLFCLVVGVKYLSNRWLSKTLPEEHPEKQIVMEDLENEKPIADSAPVAMPVTEEVKKEEALAPAPVVETPKSVETKKVTMKKKKTAKKKTAQKKPTSVATTDPYTDGGPLDLDRKENQTQPSTVATPSAPTIDERDQIIPFESK
ncbi:MAG: hypothetical protein HY877_07885 [Deltaproteobacteria bacterium]|nr:hypothetical protein [Deltaproteobacteria bacterium]